MGGTVTPQFTIDPPNQVKYEIEPPGEGQGRQFEEQNKLSPNDRQANEFFLGLASGASGLPETEHPVKDALRALAQPESMRDQAINAIAGPGAGLARGIYGIGKELFSPKQAGESDEDAAARRSHAVGSAVGQVLPLMIGEAAEKAPAAAAKVKAGIPDEWGAKLRDPETNKLKPGVKLTVGLGSVVGGGVAGHLAGIPGGGELAGYLLSKDFADSIIPDHPDYVRNQAYEEKAQDLMRRGKEQTALDKQAAKNGPKPPALNPFAGSTSTMPAEVQTMPTRSLPNTPAGSASGLPQASDVRTTPFSAKFVSKFEQPATTEVSPAAQDLISRTQRLVQPGEMPTPDDLKRAGDLTQAPLLRLKALAKFGDKLAQNELARRLKNE